MIREVIVNQGITSLLTRVVSPQEVPRAVLVLVAVTVHVVLIVASVPVIPIGVPVMIVVG